MFLLDFNELTEVKRNFQTAIAPSSTFTLFSFLFFLNKFISPQKLLSWNHFCSMLKTALRSHYLRSFLTLLLVWFPRPPRWLFFPVFKPDDDDVDDELLVFCGSLLVAVPTPLLGWMPTLLGWLTDTAGPRIGPPLLLFTTWVPLFGPIGFIWKLMFGSLIFSNSLKFIQKSPIRWMSPFFPEYNVRQDLQTDA